MALCIPPCLWDAAARRAPNEPCRECKTTLRSYVRCCTYAQVAAIFFTVSFAVLVYWFFAYHSPNVLWHAFVGSVLYRSVMKTSLSHRVPMLCAGYHQFRCLLITLDSDKKVVWIMTSPESVLAYSKMFSLENVPRRLPNNLW